MTIGGRLLLGDTMRRTLRSDLVTVNDLGLLCGAPLYRHEAVGGALARHKGTYTGRQHSVRDRKPLSETLATAGFCIMCARMCRWDEQMHMWAVDTFLIEGL